MGSISIYNILCNTEHNIVKWGRNMNHLAVASNYLFNGNQIPEIMNIPLLVITVVILLIALGICMFISKRHKLFFRKKRDKKEKDKTYTVGDEFIL